MPPKIQDVRSQVDKALIKACRQKQAEATKLDPDYGRLWEVISQVTVAGGKRLRSYMIMLSHQAYGGTTNIMPIAVAWELMHVCLLAHDDIIDRDYVRRGQPNIAGHYLKIYGGCSEPTHYADCAALIGGNAALAAAYDVVVSDKTLTPQEKLLTMQALAGCTFAECGGELIDTEAVMRPIGDVNAEKIAYLKTAPYSFTAPLMLGAQLAGAPSTELKKIEQLSNAAAIGFQLADDLLGVFGNEDQTGKSTTGDLREGKRTMLLQELASRAQPHDNVHLQSIVGHADITEADADFVRSLAVKLGAKQAVEDRIQYYHQKATKLADTLQIPSEYRQALLQLVDMALKRSH